MRGRLLRQRRRALRFRTRALSRRSAARRNGKVPGWDVFVLTKSKRDLFSPRRGSDVEPLAIVVPLKGLRPWVAITVPRSHAPRVLAERILPIGTAYLDPSWMHRVQ